MLSLPSQRHGTTAEIAETQRAAPIHETAWLFHTWDFGRCALQHPLSNLQQQLCDIILLRFPGVVLLVARASVRCML